MSRFYDIDQNSEGWDELRLGKFTASSFGDLFMDRKTKTYRDAIIKVAYERVTGESEERYSNKWMLRGHEKEPQARENYELLTFNRLENGGFWEYNDFVGASPDARIVGKVKGLTGGCEFKCPSFQVYHEYLETQLIPKSYFWQIHGQMLCTGWDFIHYMPFSSPFLKQIMIPVYRDEEIIAQLKEQLEISIEEVKRMMERIKR